MNRPATRFLLILMFLLSALASALISVSPATAAQRLISICTTESLRLAFRTMDISGETITFDCSGTLSFTVSQLYELEISGNVTIDAAGEDVTIDLGGTGSMFYIPASRSLTLKGLKFTGGKGVDGTVPLGGVVTNDGGFLTIVDSTFASNQSVSSEGGGAILNRSAGQVTISNSTFSNNSTTGAGGAIHNASGTLVITNSTFSGNTAQNGGAIANAGILTLTHDTLSANTATQWGNGVFNGTADGATYTSGGSTLFTNTLLANADVPSRGVGQGVRDGGNCSGWPAGFIWAGDSVDDDGSCFNIIFAATVETSALQLGPLADNGGPTQTIALGPDSIAIDQAQCLDAVTTDQRDYPRPSAGAATCDIGAYEAGAQAPIEITEMSHVSGLGFYGSTATLTAELSASGDEVVGRLVTFTLNGTNVGSATTDGDGVATLTGISLAGIAVGTYAGAVVASFSGDATHTGVSHSGPMTVRKAIATITFDAATLVQTYDGGLHPVTATTVPAGLSYSISYEGVATPPTNARTYLVTATIDDPSYEGTVVDFLTVNKVELTIKADDVSIVAGATIPPLTYTPTGFVNGENASVLFGAPILSTTATQSSPPGTYPINVQIGTEPGHLFAVNYSFVTASGTLTIVPTGVDPNENVAPIALDDAYTAAAYVDGTQAATPLTVDAPGVLGNDHDADGDALHATIVSKPANGVVFLQADGSFDYYPKLNFTGDDTFTYKANDGQIDSNIATVTISVAGAAENSAPTMLTLTPNSVAENSAIGTVVGVFTTGDPDVADTHTYSLVSGEGGEDNGSFTIDGDKLLTNTGLDFETKSSYAIRVRTDDGHLGTLDGMLTIFILDVDENSPPIAADDAYATAEDTPLTISAAGVLSNDTASDGNPLIAVLLTKPSNGTVILNTDGSFTYSPNSNFNGSDSFTYKANDGALDSDPATVVITVNSVNDLPVVEAGGPYSVDEGGSVLIRATGSDVEPGALKFAWDLDNNGNFETFAQETSFSAATLDGPATVTVTVRISDAGGGTATATAEITINNVDPVVSSFAPTTIPALTGQLVTFNLLASDVPGDPLQTTYDCGDVTAARDGGCFYVRGGSYSVSVLVEDGDEGTATAQLPLEVYGHVSLCAVRGTGSLSMASQTNDCGWNGILIELPRPDFDPLSICVNSWNGAARSSNVCGRSEYQVTTTGQDTVAVCINRWNGALRVSDNCSRSEREDWL